MKSPLSKLLLSSAILAAHASYQPAYTIRDFDPSTYNHTQGSSQYSGYPNITAFTVELEGGSEWNTMTTYNISFNATFIDTTDPVVSTYCMAYGYVFNPGCHDTNFGNGVVAYTKFDLKLNDDRSADLLIRWQPRVPSGSELIKPPCWQELNVTKHIPADQILGPIPAGGDGGFLYTYTGVDNFFPDGQSLSWGGIVGKGRSEGGGGRGGGWCDVGLSRVCMSPERPDTRVCVTLRSRKRTVLVWQCKSPRKVPPPTVQSVQKTDRC